MSADQSLNNDFILHQEKMTNVLGNIQAAQNSEWPGWRLRKLPREAKNVSPFSSSLYFYWGINPYQNHQRGRLLFSKRYIDKQGQEVEEGWWGYCTPFCVGKVRGSYVSREERIQYSINMVREYYTDGVRAIGAME